MLFKKKVSTKELYLVGIHEVIKKTYDSNTDMDTMYWKEEPDFYTFATKIDDYFVDIFTGTKYDKIRWLLKPGDYGVGKAMPFTSQHKSVAQDILQEELNRLNQGIFDKKNIMILNPKKY